MAGSVTSAAMIATPLMPKGGTQRRVLSSVVVAGMAATTAGNATVRWGAGRVAGAIGAVTATTMAVERLGTATGLPFGRYEYSRALQPQLGGVPAIVPVAWFAMAIPSREAAHAALGSRSTPLTRIVVGAAALTAWDLFLDPQMVGEGYWTWARRGIYRGIPVGNYLGWFVTSLGVMTIVEIALPVTNAAASSADSADSPAAPDAALVGSYGFVALMETIGFARYFRDPVVATVGGIAMLPLAGLAAARRLAS